MAKQKIVPSTKSEKPAKNLSKVTKPRAKKETKSNIMADMVTDAFKQITNKDGADGFTLSKIRNYISKTFDVDMTKPNQTLIKKFIGKEFREGRIFMTNDRGNVIDYTKRFQMVDEESMESDEAEE